MGAGSSVGANFVKSEFRDALATSFEEEAAKLGMEKEKAKALLDTMYTKSEAISPLASPGPKAHCNTLVCATDGSEASDIAFAAAKVLLKKNDHLCMFHAYSPSSDEALPIHLRSEAIKEKLNIDLIATYPTGKFSFLWEDKRDQKSKDVIIKLVDSFAKLNGGLKPEFLIMGYTGRKGISKADGPTTIGSTADFAMRTIRLPIVIIKNAVTTAPKSFIMAVDGSDISKAGLDILYYLIKPQDTLTLIHVYEMGMASEDVEKYYTKELTENAPTVNVKYQSIMKEQNSTSVADILAGMVNENAPDFFAIAPRTRINKSTYTVTESLILSVKSNIVLCKV